MLRADVTDWDGLGGMAERARKFVLLYNFMPREGLGMVWGQGCGKVGPSPFVPWAPSYLTPVATPTWHVVGAQ